MISYLSCLIAFVLCAFVYIRMVKREEPGTLGKKSIVPVALGFVAPVLSTILLIAVNITIVKIAGNSFSISIPNPVLRSLAKAFFGAGFTEELVKLLLALLAVAIVKPKNVYTYALMFIGVGFGFTALEEFLYGGGNILFSLIRLPGFAFHMIFGMIMGVHLGIARTGGSSRHVFAALVLPVLWHTVYDAATVNNVGLKTQSIIGLVLALAVSIASIVLQFIMLSNFKKRSKDLCQMELIKASKDN